MTKQNVTVPLFALFVSPILPNTAGVSPSLLHIPHFVQPISHEIRPTNVASIGLALQKGKLWNLACVER